MTKKTLHKKPQNTKLKYAFYTLVSTVFMLFLSGILVLANGYLPSYKDGRFTLQKTGMVILSVRPIDSNIVVNGKFKEKSAFYLLQNKLSNLLPGSYDIRIEKKGYRTWQNKVVVEPGLVSWANYVILFPEKLDIRNITEPVGNLLAANRNKDNLLFTNTKDGVFSASSVGASGVVSKSFWPKDTGSFPEWLKSPQIVSASYSENSDKVLYEVKNGELREYVIVEQNGSDLKTTILNDQLKQNPETVSWDPYDNNALFIRIAGSLYHLGQSSVALNNPISANVVSYSPEPNKQLYYATRSANGNVSIIKSAFDGGNKIVILDAQATSGNYKFSHSSFNDTLGVLNRDNGELLLVSPASSDHSTILRLGKNYRDFVWQKNGQKLLFYNENNVSRYDLERKKVARFENSKKVLSVSWYFDENHYLVNSENGLEIMDYDGTNKVVLHSSQAVNIMLDINNDNLVYSVNEGGVLKFYSFISLY